MSGIKVADLYGLLGLKVDESQWKRGNQAIGGMKSALVGLAAYFGGALLGKSLIGFNADVQETKTQIAGMLALTKKTDLADQVAVADQLYANLQKRAASLPGTTAEYAQMLGAVTQSITDAGLGLQDLEDITVNAVVGAKAFGISWDVAARDIDQALRGQFHSVDQFTGKILGSIGFKGESGRKKFNAMSQKERGETLKRALTQKQLTQLAEAQGNSFRGVLSTVQDTIQQFFGRVGAPLFKAITTELKSWIKWLDANKERVDAFAQSVGAGLVVAFGAVKSAVLGVVDVINFFIEHAELGKSVVIALGIVLAAFAIDAAIAWAIAFAPLIAAVAILTAIVLAVRKMVDVFKNGSTAMKAAIAGVAIALGLLIGPLAPILAAVAAIAAYWDDVKTAIIDATTAVERFFEKVGNAAFGTADVQKAGQYLIDQKTAGAAAGGTGVTAPASVPTTVPAYATAASSTTTSTVSNTFQINGATDPQAVATAVDQRLQKVFADSHDTRRGGKR